VRNQSGTYQLTNSANNNSIIDRIGAFGQMVAATIKAGYIQTQKLIVDGIDVAAKLAELSGRIDKQEQTIRQLQTELEQLKAHQ
jgi:UDP-N-acetylglucosamine enolpyruvyl transferase